MTADRAEPLRAVHMARFYYPANEPESEVMNFPSSPTAKARQDRSSRSPQWADTVTHQLRDLYGSIEQEPIPPSILDLLRRLIH